jgi:hypothetical protein
MFIFNKEFTKKSNKLKIFYFLSLSFGNSEQFRDFYIYIISHFSKVERGIYVSAQGLVIWPRSKLRYG